MRARRWQSLQRRLRVLVAVGAGGPFGGGGLCLLVQGMVPVGETWRALPLSLSPPSLLPPTCATRPRQRWRSSLAHCRVPPLRRGGFHPRRCRRVATQPVATAATPVRVALRHQSAFHMLWPRHPFR